MSSGRRSDFRKLFAGQAISQVGSHITREGLPLTAVLVLSASPFEMGILNGASAAAVLLLGLFAGAWADRMRRRPILMATDVARAALLATIPLAAWAGRLSMAHLVLVAAASGILTVLFEVAYQAYVPSLAGAEGRPDELVKANSRLALSESMAEVIGPGLTGALVQALTAPIAIAFDAFSFLVSAASLWWIGSPEAPPSAPEGPRRQPHILREILEGLRFSWSNPYLRPLLLSSGTAFFFGGFQSALYILFAIKALRLTPALLGVLISVGGASAVLGTLAAPRVIRRWGSGNSLIGAMALDGAAMFLIPLAHGPVWLAAAFLAAAQAGDAGWPIFNVNHRSIRQSVAPPHLLARVNSAAHLMSHAAIPIGALAGGALAGAIGMRPTMFLAAAGFSLSVLWLVFSPARGLRLEKSPLHSA